MAKHEYFGGQESRAMRKLSKLGASISLDRLEELLEKRDEIEDMREEKRRAGSNPGS